MGKKGVLRSIGFIFFTILSLVLIFSGVAVTVLNTYKPIEKVYINGEFIGYFSSAQQFDEVYNDLVSEKQKIDPNVKVYLDNEPTFQTSYIRDSLLAEQNIYTNLRAYIKTEYTTYDVAVNGEIKMTFNTQDEANKYATNLKKEVSKLNVEVKTNKVSELGEMTTTERADNILKDIVDRNKPVVVSKTTVVNKTYQTVNVGAASVQATGSGVWPTVSRNISCHFMGYSGHTGTDITGQVGYAIYAFRAGTVTFSGWGTGYGNHIKIDHGNGMSTLYAHCSTLNVSVGQQVAEGQLIARIGMTGYTTGPHLHFEIRLNGVPVNAYPYIVGK